MTSSLAESRDGNIERAFEYAEELMEIITKYDLLPLEKRDRTGGAFVFFEPNHNWVTIFPIGNIRSTSEETSGQRAAQFIHFGTEKAIRLSKNPDHQTSWQSRDVDAKQYGGAIRIAFNGGYFIFSFSGLPECWDEALMLGVAIRMKWMTREDAHSIAHESTRRCLSDLLLHCP